MNNKITISIMSLRDYTWKYYDIYNKDNFNESISLFLKEKDHDFEIQLIDTDYIGLSDDNLHSFLNIMNKFSEVNPQDIIYLLNYYDEDDVIEILEQELFYTIVSADNKVQAFEDYVHDYEILYIPDNLESYIDWERVLIDYECGGLLVTRVDNGKYLIIDK